MSGFWINMGCILKWVTSIEVAWTRKGNKWGSNQVQVWEEKAIVSRGRGRITKLVTG